MTLPLFPLHTVLFPGGQLALRIFETRYLDMVSHCLRAGSGFGVCQIREGEEVGGDADIFTVGTQVRITDWDQRNDGLLGITVEGVHKFRVMDSTRQADKLLLGEVEYLSDESETALPDEFRSLSEMLERILNELRSPYARAPAYDRAGWVGARLSELLPLEPQAKQRMLELDEPLARLFWLRDAMMNMDFV